ncbi:DUF4112 domain-containing protein [Citreimonas salinaria]|uniref:DUF4112 domain-containing protein n=1 Tax=Citreimonas salinaria TaxID=321339 RepID=A0A1H3GZY7_9RHOB|nr:DUF4112 domain-containing protein [Citreimonas salinaria]SDY08687.1 protein of unknown function [Citreimonas salinaria]
MEMHPDFQRLARAERVARRMDNAVRIPFTRVTFGVDAVLGLVPGIGDAMAMLPSLYILQVANMAGAPRRLLGRMAWNIGMDFVIGLVPLVGDVLDIAYKANLRNVALLKAHVESRHAVLRDVAHGAGDNVVPLFPPQAAAGVPGAPRGPEPAVRAPGN